jgi:hypothetical protein
MNNSYVSQDCPALMSDGRFVTDYRPSNELHSSIRYHNRLYDSNQYRQFMINNAEKMMQMTRDFYSDLRGCKAGNQGCTLFSHPDPSNQDTFWANYRKHLYGEAPTSGQPMKQGYIYQ